MYVLPQQELPDRIQILEDWVPYKKDQILVLYYRDTPDALYKIPEAIAGVTISSVCDLLNKGGAKEYTDN